MQKLFWCFIRSVRAVASWLVRSSPDRAVRVRALAGDIVLCSWARHLTLTVPLSTQVCTGELNAEGNPAMDCSYALSSDTTLRVVLAQAGSRYCINFGVLLGPYTRP